MLLQVTTCLKHQSSVFFILQMDIPDSILSSFYHGDVYVGIKDSVLQPSSPLRHACELKDILKLRGGNKAVVRAFSCDGLAEMKLNYIIV